jgi:hypothetical protein
MQNFKGRGMGHYVGAERPGAAAVTNEKYPHRTEQVFKFIVDYKHAHDGNSPTMREIMAGCKISTTSLIFFYLNKLEEQGFIRRFEPPNGSRSFAKIEVIGGKWIYLGGKHESS